MSPLNRNLAILVAEDDESYALLLKRAFGEIDLTNPLHLLCDGQEVIDYLAGIGKYADRTSYPLPGMMVLDLKMPRVDGFEVLRRVKSDPALRSIPIVMLTSSRHDPDVRRSYSLGANGYIVKPMDLAQYTKVLQDFGRFWLEVNETPPETKDFAHAASENE